MNVDGAIGYSASQVKAGIIEMAIGYGYSAGEVGTVSLFGSKYFCNINQSKYLMTGVVLCCIFVVLHRKVLLHSTFVYPIG